MADSSDKETADSGNEDIDIEILKANKHLARLREDEEKRQLMRGRRASKGLDLLLKPLFKEAKKMQRHPITEWYDVWIKIVGEEISAQTRVKDLRNGFLRVEVANPALRTELEAFYSADLLTALQEEKTDVLLRGIKFILAGNK